MSWAKDMEAVMGNVGLNPEAVTDEKLENIKARIARHEDWSVSVDRLIARIDQERQANEALRTALDREGAALKLVLKEKAVAEEALARMDNEVADHISALVDTQSRLAAAEAERNQAELGWRQTKEDLAQSESERAELQRMVTEDRKATNEQWHRANEVQSRLAAAEKVLEAAEEAWSECDLSPKHPEAGVGRRWCLNHHEWDYDNGTHCSFAELRSELTAYREVQK